MKINQTEFTSDTPCGVCGRPIGEGDEEGSVTRDGFNFEPSCSEACAVKFFEGDIVDALIAAGFDAEYNIDLGPTEIRVTLDKIADHHLLLAKDFNREDGGWEAVLEIKGDQAGLDDGPGSEATSAQIVEWVTALTN